MPSIFSTDKNGFTMIELIVALAVIIFALTGSFALTTMSVTSTQASRSRIIALNLSQEGLEIVRNIRDNNWLVNKRTALTWQDGLGEDSGPVNYLVQYNALSLLAYSNIPLRFNNGFFQYDSGPNSIFYRTITIERISDNQLKITSEVNWSEQGKNRNIKAEVELYNWMEES